MKNLMFILVATALTSLSAFAGTPSSDEVRRKSLTIQSVQTVDLTSQYALNVNARSLYESAPLYESAAGAGAALGTAEVVVDKIINIGTKIWNVIERGRPVSNYTSTRANALPEGATRWDQLDGWQEPTSKVYGVIYKNMLGMEVVRMVYRVTVLYGGSANGVGRYIGYTSVDPVSITVAPLYQLDATAAVDSVYNTGSRTNPVAGMILNVGWRVRNVLTDNRQSHTLTIDARGGLRMTRDTSANLQ